MGVLIPGMGAVTTTFIGGVAAIRKGLGNPIGSLTQMGTIRLGKRTDNRSPKINEFVPLAGLDDLVFGGWDIFPENMYEAAVKADVLTQQTLGPIKDELAAIQPMSAVFDKNYVKLIDGPNVKQGATLMDKAEMLMEDIRQFKERNNCARLVMIWCGSTEVFHSKTHVHETMEAFEAGLRNNDPAIAPSQVYAYAASPTRRSVYQRCAQPHHRRPGPFRLRP
ncbi:MAG: inositol-3-phosphate synthase [Bryobacterales bacterium]|nr:inositol-3-phosphate synthase [Bryobacterales bacterium]